MNKTKLIKASLLNAVASTLYIALVAWLMSNGQKLFGKVNSVLSGTAILLLFVISAAIMGALILGKPILLYLDGAKKEALKLFYFTIFWLALMAFLAFIVLAIF